MAGQGAGDMGRACVRKIGIDGYERPASMLGPVLDVDEDGELLSESSMTRARRLNGNARPLYANRWIAAAENPPEK